MGIWMTGALVVGCVIGSGIFLLPVSLAPLGTNATLGWVISGAGALAIAYSLALISRNGAGIQTSVEESFGPTVAFLVTFPSGAATGQLPQRWQSQRHRRSPGSIRRYKLPPSPFQLRLLDCRAQPRELARCKSGRRTFDHHRTDQDYAAHRCRWSPPATRGQRHGRVRGLARASEL